MNIYEDHIIILNIYVDHIFKFYHIIIDTMYVDSLRNGNNNLLMHNKYGSSKIKICKYICLNKWSINPDAYQVKSGISIN